MFPRELAVADAAMFVLKYRDNRVWWSIVTVEVADIQLVRP